MDRLPSLVILPNDTAFPYDRLVDVLHQRGIAFVLLQESIRFTAPALEERPYGAGGAAAVAAWGESSAAYFTAQGVPPERVHVTGNPRYDRILGTDWSAEAARARDQWRLGDSNLLFISNPIDDLGFCTTAQKLRLVSDFAGGLGPLFEEPDFRLLVKLHGRESVRDFKAALGHLPHADRITVLDGSLYALFALARAAVVMASTAGLEALAFGLPLGALELPGVGFVYDYVSSGAALGLRWDQPMHAQVRSLLIESQDVDAVSRFLDSNLARRGSSTDAVVDLVEHVLGEVGTRAGRLLDQDVA
jgi:hypothetical protein